MGIKSQVAINLARIGADFWIHQIHNPIFIIGTARSGTSLLARLVSGHPEIANWSEANVIWDPTGYPSPPDKAPDWVDPYIFNNRWWGDTQNRIKEIPATFGLFQWFSRKPYLLNKSPFNTFRIPHILQLFPEARFINVVRHGLAVVSSRLKKEGNFVNGMPYRFPPDETLYDFETCALCFARLWRLSVQEVVDQDKRLGLSEGKLLCLSYEELCTDPSSVVKKIEQFIGLKSPITVRESIQNQNIKWRQVISKELAPKLVERMQPTFSELGYKL